MNLEKNLKNFGRCVLGTVLATSLFFSCDNGTTTTKRYDEEEPVVTTGNIQGRVVYPTIENNSLVWEGKKDATILIDGKGKGKSVADGLFYISSVETGARNLKASYLKQFLSEEMGVPVYEGKLTTINKDIQMIPTDENYNIVYGIIYSNSSKNSRYSGRLRVIGGPQSRTDIFDGIYAFQGNVDGREMMIDINPGISARRVKFFDRQNNESWQIDLGNSWIAEQNGYIVE
jgi:hypothetical protein